MSFGLLSGIGSVLGGLGGIFGKKKKDPTPAQNLLSQAQGARQAADQYGFNPLTMLQYGQPGGAMGGGGGSPSPLASIQMLTDGLAGLDDIVSGDAARRRAADQLNLDLAQLKLDQTRSGVLVTQTPYAVNQFGPSPLGVRPVTVQQSAGGPRGGFNVPAAGVSVQGASGDRSVAPAGSGGERPLMEVDSGSIVSDPRRPVDNDPVKSHSGTLIVDNPNLPVPLRVPTLDGDEALQWYDYPSLIVPGIVAGIDFLNTPAFGPPRGYTSDGEYIGDREPWEPVAKPKGKPLPDYYTHAQTGFTAKRGAGPDVQSRSPRPKLPAGYKGYTISRNFSPSYYSDKIYGWLNSRKP